MEELYYSKGELNVMLHYHGLVSYDLAKILKKDGYNTSFPLFRVYKNDSNFYILTNEQSKNESILIPSYQEINHYMDNKYHAYLHIDEKAKLVKLKDSDIHDDIIVRSYDNNKYDVIDDIISNYIRNANSWSYKYQIAKVATKKARIEYMKAYNEENYLWGKSLKEQFERSIERGEKYEVVNRGKTYELVSLDEVVSDQQIFNPAQILIPKINVTVKTTGKLTKSIEVAFNQIKKIQQIDENISYEI